ncbi:DBF4B protein, partial [Centropus unirufus]|nr:DBF4B protein [Centropus unirufus]
TESFLSKEVTHVISSNKEAKRDKARTRAEKQSSTTSEDATATSPVPSASKGTHSIPHRKPPDTALISRGKELLQKAIKNQVSCTGNSILANARLWGVQILHVDGILLCGLELGCWGSVIVEAVGSLARTTSNQLCFLAGKLKPPFLKVEDESRQFRPFHLQFKTFPDLNFLAPKSSSPFEPLKSQSNSCKARLWEVAVSAHFPPAKGQVLLKRASASFQHLQSPQHKCFALDNSQYAPVDRVISQLTSSF